MALTDEEKRLMAEGVLKQREADSYREKLHEMNLTELRAEVKKLEPKEKKEEK